ncbi:unnamed protein product [Urochloa humidicola]
MVQQYPLFPSSIPFVFSDPTPRRSSARTTSAPPALPDRARRRQPSSGPARLPSPLPGPPLPSRPPPELARCGSLWRRRASSSPKIRRGSSSSAGEPRRARSGGHAPSAAGGEEEQPAREAMLAAHGREAMLARGRAELLEGAGWRRQSSRRGIWPKEATGDERCLDGVGGAAELAAAAAAGRPGTRGLPPLVICRVLKVHPGLWIEPPRSAEEIPR